MTERHLHFESTLLESGYQCDEHDWIIFFQKMIYLLYVPWCFSCIHVCVRVSGTMVLESQTVVNCRMGAGT